MMVQVQGHCGGFIVDGQKVFEVGFVSDDGALVCMPREVFDAAAAWIAENEVDTFEERHVVIETRDDA